MCHVCFLVMLKDVMVASTAPVKSNTEAKNRDESAGAGGMERLCFLIV